MNRLSCYILIVLCMYHGYADSKAVNQDDELKDLREEVNALKAFLKPMVSM